jgi:Ca-activated chloride channel family protein
VNENLAIRAGAAAADGLQDLNDDFDADRKLVESAPAPAQESKDQFYFRQKEVAELEVMQQRGTVAQGLGGEQVEELARRSRLSVDALSSIEKKDMDGETDFGLATADGRGPDVSGDKFEPITDNAFLRVSEQPLSTFSVDVDTASYSKVRDFLMRANQLPRPDSVRIEELLNYFSYSYEPPADSAEHPFATRVDVTSCPWNQQHRLARVALKGKTMEPEDRPQCNLVFLLDTSGSMDAPNKLPLVIDGLKMLLTQLKPDDKVAIAVYAGSAGLVLDSTPVEQQDVILKALTELAAGGSTNGGAGIALAYQTARDHFITEGVNRVILCTDGDFNVGTTSTDELVRMVEQEAKGGVFLSVLGFGMGNHNDAMLEQVSGRGNGNYAFIDSPSEAHKVFVEQTNGTLVTIAKDVKLQIEFNPKNVAAYRLIGYENRVLAKEDFKDDTKDAGEIGAGHSVTALYELVPAGVEVEPIAPKVDDLRYQQAAGLSAAADSDELLTLKLRYKEPDGETSKEIIVPTVEQEANFADADDDFRFAAAVASFGMQLRRSPHAGNWTMSDAMNAANQAKADDRFGLRSEFITLVQKASELMGEE